jgi:hypothetical protein
MPTLPLSPKPRQYNRVQSNGIAGYFSLLPPELQRQRVRQLLRSGMSVDFVCSLTSWGPRAVRNAQEGQP